MIKIKIAHLYYDLMNLYGENGNVRALKRFIEKEDVKCEIHFLTIKDKIDFSKYDAIYMGMGTEKSLLLVLDDIKQYKNEIKYAINNGVHFLITGNSSELFGKYILDEDGSKHDALGIFPYYAVHENFRIVGSLVFSSKLINEKIIGFQNRCGVMKDIDKPLFKVIEGTGAFPEYKKEGYCFKNFYATYIIGPFFIRNPYFTNYIVKNMIKSKNKKYKFKVINRFTEVKAYNTYLENFNITN